MSTNLLSRSCILIGAALAITACGDANGPEVLSSEELSGSYVTAVPTSNGTAFGSLVFTTTENGVAIDRTARGAEIRLTLGRDGTTAGSLVIPDVEGESGDLETFTADLTGTWQLDGSIVHLDHKADTFLRDMPLTVKGDRLEGDRTFGDVRVRVALVRR